MKQKTEMKKMIRKKKKKENKNNTLIYIGSSSHFRRYLVQARCPY